MSVRLRLVLWQTLLLGLVLGAFAVVVYVGLERQETSRLEAELRVAADDVRQAYFDARDKAREAEYAAEESAEEYPADAPRRGPRHDDVPPSPELVNPSITAALDDATFVAQIVAADGDVLADSQNRERPLPLPDVALDRLFAGGGLQAAADVAIAGEAFKLYGDPLPGGSQRPGGSNASLAVVVAAPLAPVAATLARWRLTLGAAVLGTMAAAAAVAWFLASQAMRPVDRMTRAARAIAAAADFDRRLPEPARQDELGRLAVTFNRMLGQLGEAFANQNRFLADASHELRTPLTVIRTNTEALLRGAAADPAEREETLRATAREAARMGRLVDDLLALARADAGQPLARRRFALDTLVLEVYQQGRSLAGGDRLALDEWEQVEVEGDADRIKQVALNLIDNALRHTPAASSVTLDLVRRGDAVVLRVRDRGPGIPPAALSRIFERFYRVDQPRTRQTGTGGSGGSGTGLGLAISRDVDEAHGGRIEVESRVGAGSTFSLVLPTAAPPASAPAPAPAPVAAPRTLPSH